MSTSVTPDPQVGFEMSSLSVSEGAASVEVIITASGATYVEMYMEDGTAQGIGNRTGCRIDGCSTPTIPPSQLVLTTTPPHNYSTSHLLAPERLLLLYWMMQCMKEMSTSLPISVVPHWVGSS